MFAVTFARNLHAVATPQLYVGLVCTAQFAVFCYLQFGYHVETLEMYYFSSTLWGVLCLALAVILGELCVPLSKHRLARWVPALLLVVVPLGYEAYPHVPSFGWLPAGACLAGVAVAFTAVLRVANRGRGRRAALSIGSAVITGTAVVAMAGALLVLTVAPSPLHPPLQGLAHAADPPAPYSSALGGNASFLVDWYQVSVEVPSFVGNARYRGEQLLMWFPYDPSGVLTETVGIYHGRFNSLPSDPGVLTAPDVAMLASKTAGRGAPPQHHRRPVRERPAVPRTVPTGPAPHGCAPARRRCAPRLADRARIVRPRRPLTKTHDGSVTRTVSGSGCGTEVGVRPAWPVDQHRRMRLVPLLRGSCATTNGKSTRATRSP